MTLENHGCMQDRKKQIKKVGEREVNSPQP